MEFTIVLFGFLLVQSCRVLGAHHRLHARDMASHRNHNAKRGLCDKTQTMQFNENMRNSICKPRETMVVIPSEATDILVIPSKVAVDRCDGVCYGKTACLPVEVEQVNFAVHKRNFVTGREWCDTVTVTQHVRCECGCALTEASCADHQQLLKHECRCACRNEKEQHSCKKQGKEWDSDSCQCQCSEKQQCSSGTKWSSSECKCLHVGNEDGHEKHHGRRHLGIIVENT